MLNTIVMLHVIVMLNLIQYPVAQLPRPIPGSVHRSRDALHPTTSTRTALHPGACAPLPRVALAPPDTVAHPEPTRRSDTLNEIPELIEPHTNNRFPGEYRVDVSFRVKPPGVFEYIAQLVSLDTHISGAVPDFADVQLSH